MDKEIIEINGHPIPRNSRVTIDLSVAKLYTHTEVALPVQVIRGKHPGPVLFVVCKNREMKNTSSRIPGFSYWVYFGNFIISPDQEPTF